MRHRVVWVGLIIGLMIVSLGCGLLDFGEETLAPTTEATPVPVETEDEDDARPKASPTPVPPTAVPPTSEPSEGLSLEVINQSEEDIWYLFVAPSENENWGEDVLGDEIILAGGSFRVEGLAEGVYDLQALDPDEAVIDSVWGVDLAEMSTWTVRGGGSASEDAVSLEVTNMTSVPVAELYVSPVDADDWGQNVLSGDIPVGESTFLEDVPPGWYDLKAVDAEGETLETLYRVDMSDGYSWYMVGKTPLPDNAVLRFEDAFDDNRNDWGNDETDEVRYNAPSDGMYCMDIKVTDLTAWEWYEPFSTEEFVAEVACQVDVDTDATCGLGVGPDGDNLYWFEVSPGDQTFAVYLLENDEWQEPLIDWTASKHISDIGWNMLSMERLGDTISVYINGVWMADAPGGAFGPGRIAIGGASYQDANVDICLDDLRVWQLE